MTMPDPHDLADLSLRARAVRAARGQEPFDLLITGGTLADMATGELRAADVGIVGPMIASVHPPGAMTRADATRDATGLIVAPGLIDTHMHIESSMVTPRSYAATVVPQGTTTICWDPHEVANVLGLPGVRWAIEASRGLPLRVLVLAPSCVPSAPGLERAGAIFDAGEMRTMLSWPEILGVAEVMDMRGVVEGQPRMQGIVGAGLTSGKLVCGHARGLGADDLQSFAAAGIQSDHEITSGDDFLAKLRAGFTIELRGSHDYVLPGVVAALATLKRFPQTVTLCTDDVFPDDLVRAGGMIDVLRRLVRHGLPPMDGLLAATLNAAIRIGRPDLGLVAAGRRADILLVSDMTDLRVLDVFASGQHVAANGVLRAPLRPDPVPLPRGTVKLAPLTEDDFRLKPASPGKDMIRLRTVKRPRFTEWGELEVPLRDGAAALPDGAILMAVMHRHGQRAAAPVLGVLQGWGHWDGALATTVAHDSHNLMVFGREPRDLAAAANAVIATEGGMATALGGVVTAVLRLAACGLVSDAPTAAVAEDFAALKAAAEAIADWTNEVSLIKAIVGASLACNPGPHVTDLGISDGSTGQVFSSMIDA